MRRTYAEIQGIKPQEYADISRFSDAKFQYRGKQKIQELIGASIISSWYFLKVTAINYQGLLL